MTRNLTDTTTSQKSSLLRIVPFRPENQDFTKKLINPGLSEHWGFLDQSRNPDLNDIANAYKDGVFLIAWLGDEIIGTGALIQHSELVAQIVRMSVAAHARRQGIGCKILETLVQAAKDRGFKKVVLETTQSWLGVIHFYTSFGFQITHYENGDAYFFLLLD